MTDGLRSKRARILAAAIFALPQSGAKVLSLPSETAPNMMEMQTLKQNFQFQLILLEVADVGNTPINEGGCGDVADTDDGGDDRDGGEKGKEKR